MNDYPCFIIPSKTAHYEQVSDPVFAVDSNGVIPLRFYN